MTFILTALTEPPGSPSPTILGEVMTSTSEALAHLGSDYWEGVLRRNPTLATFYGDSRFNDKLPDAGPAGRAAEATALRELEQRCSEIVPAGLSAEERISLDVLVQIAALGLAALPFRLDEMAVDQMDGPQVWLPQLLNWHPTDTTTGVEQLIARYHAFPVYMDQYLENLRDGMRDGRTSPQLAVDRVVNQVKQLLATPVVDSPLSEPAKRWPAQAQDLLAAVEKAVYPTYRRMLGFLENDYRSRAEPGVWSVKDGEQIYSLLCERHTTTKLRPAELHQIGLDELASIQAEMREVMRRLGDTSGDIPDFTRRLLAEPSNLWQTGEEIVDEASELLSEAQARLPQVFGRIPSIQCEVKPIEEYLNKDAPAAYYFPPSQEGTRPGTFFVNTYDPKSRPRHNLRALTFHEAVPGHHMQIAISVENSDLPVFRRLGLEATAYVEGWGLYSERLADELGLYGDDESRFGMLGYQAWRACRLVVDTGMHHLRWSRRKALDFMLDNVGLSALETANEVDRYIIWPGQALAYKIGQREIEALRREATQALGTSFDLRAFHDEVLSHSAIPLTSLRKAVGEWVNAVRDGQPAPGNQALTE